MSYALTGKASKRREKDEIVLKAKEEGKIKYQQEKLSRIQKSGGLTVQEYYNIGSVAELLKRIFAKKYISLR